MIHHPPGRAQLIAYFEGKITDATTKEAIEAYISTDTDPLLVQVCMQTAWEHIREADVPRSTAADWDQFRMLSGIRSSRKRFLQPMLAAAATLLLLLSLSAIYFMVRKPAAVKPLAWQEITAGPGELRTIRLPDGSDLTLFPGSVVSYNNEYNKTARAIKLKGRAYFNVATIAGKPFSVSAGNYTTQVLGTSFEIFERPQRQELSVILVSGKVRLLNAQQQPLSELRPDQQMTIRTDNARFNILPVAAQSMVSWTTGKLSYDQATLADVCRELEKWYGVNITIQRTALEKKRITADFERLSLPAVMHILSETAGFNYNEKDNNIAVY
ncbi:FecR family protein [Chitinophaga pinensis]|uniref:FecR family protein n=1 Tax=Chitinophaga pinensis TaxID=79329 RepID=A0A5C6LLZ8_9BACT|nr:FecR family protein [Chitinophaga pinensis]TWV95102.1 FecR family protein [Chitinophaga pinensis]